MKDKYRGKSLGEMLSDGDEFWNHLEKVHRKEIKKRKNELRSYGLGEAFIDETLISLSSKGISPNFDNALSRPAFVENKNRVIESLSFITEIDTLDWFLNYKEGGEYYIYDQEIISYEQIVDELSRL